MLTPNPSSALLDRFKTIVGEKYAITDPAVQESYLREMRDLYRGKTAMVLRPGSVAEVSAILKLANETNTAIVPQGGNTGLVGGQIPFNGRSSCRSPGSTRSAKSIRFRTPSPAKPA